MASQNKVRSLNFTKSEQDRLVALVLEKKNIFENKRTDAVTSKQKDAAWEVLTKKFNASSQSNAVSFFCLSNLIFEHYYILVFFIRSVLRKF